MEKQPSKILLFLLPTFANVIWIAVFFGVLIFGRQMINADGDLALHLTMGRYILDHGRIPLEDVFSHTLAGQPAAQHKWLAQLIFAVAERLMGLAGVVLLCAIVIACALWLVYRLANHDGQSLFSTVFILLLVISASMVHWLTRPHVFTFLFLALWMTILNQLYKGKSQRWWLLPVLMVLWVNLHGGFIAGLVTWLLYGLGVGWDAVMERAPELAPRFWRHYLLGGVTAFFATLINPSGIGLWLMIITHLGNRYLADFTLEFNSPNFHLVALWPFLVMIGLLPIILGLSEKKINPGLLLNTATWLMMALYSGRNIPLFTIVAAPLLVGGLDDIFSRAAVRARLIKRFKQLDSRLQMIDNQLKGFTWPLLSILLVSVGLGIGLRFDLQGQGFGFDKDAFPISAVDWLEDNPQEGEMFNYFTWGGYLQYRLWPEKRVFIDSNSDFYGEAFVRQYAQVMQLAEDWEDVLEQYNVAWAILPSESLTAAEFQRQLGWSVLFQDDTAVILGRE